MSLDIGKPVYAAEFSFEKLMRAAQKMPTYKAFSPYAQISQDITVKKTASFSEMKKAIREASLSIESIALKDQYQDTITLHLVFTDRTKNITEEKVKEEIRLIQSALA